ncbi:MAG: hypothetical protein GX808_04210 [Syntrophomonadaceae bacterium]|nr:hypothetical protein [Syntrophomonadaceae bacterium]
MGGTRQFLSKYLGKYNRRKGKLLIAAKIFRLYLIHFFALIAVALAAYYPGLDIVLSILYITVLSLEAIYTELGVKGKLITAFSLHIPGLVLAAANIAGITQWDLSNYALFILQYWYIPLIPLISLLSFTTETGTPLYHYILLGLPFFMSIYYLVIMQIGITKSTSASSN